jgi:hypothetical protein
MKRIIFILLFFLIFSNTYSNQNQTIKIRYPFGICKISTDSGKTWKNEKTQSSVIRIKRTGVPMKISKDNGKTWEVLNTSSPVVRFTRLNGITKISYDFGKTWTIEAEKEFENTVNIYPNPSYSKEFILEISTSNEDLLIEIMNIGGEIVKRIIYTAKNGENAIPIDLQELQSGNYFISIVGKGTIYHGVICLIN